MACGPVARRDDTNRARIGGVDFDEQAFTDNQPQQPGSLRAERHPDASLSIAMCDSSSSARLASGLRKARLANRRRQPRPSPRIMA
jgi:hypothetical protein